MKSRKHKKLVDLSKTMLEAGNASIPSDVLGSYSGTPAREMQSGDSKEDLIPEQDADDL